MPRPSLTPIDSARTLLTEEYAQVHVERTAFETFAERVRALDPVPVPSQSPLTAPSLRDRSRAHAGVATTRDVRTAYRETVLAVEHYASVYGESLMTNLAAELGPELATAVKEERLLTRAVLQAAIASVAHAIQDRRAFLEVLDAEQVALDEAYREGDAIATELAHLDELDIVTSRGRNTACELLAELTERCRQLIDARQQEIQERVVSRYTDGHDLCTYLYADGPGDWTYPVLTVAVSLYRDLTAVRHRLGRRGSTIN